MEHLKSKSYQPRCKTTWDALYHLFCVLRMDVHRSIGAVTPESLAEGSSMAAEALHKSLVAMRKEVAKKNKVRNHGHHQLSLLYPD